MSAAEPGSLFGGLRRALQLHVQRLDEHDVTADGITLQIPQTLAATQEYQQGHQQQLPGWRPNSALHPRIGDGPQVADQGEIGCGGGAFMHKEGAIPLTSTHAYTPGKDACDGL